MSGQTLVNPPPPKVKLHCSYGGRLGCNPLDIRYCGGETKLVTVNRDIKFTELFVKLSAAFDTTEKFIVRYELRDLGMETLILVEDDDDVENMMVEYGDDDPTRTPKIRMYLFLTRGESQPGLVDGFDEVFESGSGSGSSFESEVKDDDQTVVEVKSGGSDSLPPRQSPVKSDGSKEAREKSGGSGTSQAKSGCSDEAPAKYGGSDTPPQPQPPVKSGGSYKTSAKSGGSCSPPLFQPLLNTGGSDHAPGDSCGSGKASAKSSGSDKASGDSCGSGKASVKSGGSDKAPPSMAPGESDVTGSGSWVSVPESGGEKSSVSPDTAKMADLQISSEGHMTSGTSVSVPVENENVEMQNQCEGNVSGGQAGFYVPTAVYNVVPPTMAMVRGNGVGSEENGEVKADPKTTD